MKRLVYTPKIDAYIRADSGVYDISDYITHFNVARKINQVSTAELTLRNPDKKWTEHHYMDSVTKQKIVGPIFHPMDPITIILTRLQGRPVQVFTGYCDSTPYLQLFPGTVTLTASCTLKKLLYTYFDPGLPFFWDFLTQYGWTPNFLQGGVMNAPAEEEHAEPKHEKDGVRYGDSGIGELLYGVLNKIGGWPDETIYIENIPPTVIDLVANLFELFKNDAEESQGELTTFLHQIVGTSASGGGAPGGSTPTGGAGEWVKVGATLDPTSGQAPTFSDHNGMSFAELLVAGANAGLKSEALYRIFDIKEDPSYPYGMPMETPIQIRKVGGAKAYTIYKNDVGSGQAGDTHYKIDLHPGIASAIGFSGKGDVEVRTLGGPQGKVHR
jgi:hypothetical protein